jgi:predicted phosphodiesterase
MLGIISDIHGNLPALEAVLASLDKMEVEQIVCLGDVAGYYCMINECIELLEQRNIHTLMGNHDYYITSGEHCPRSESANTCLKYQAQHITEPNLIWLSQLKPSFDMGEIRMVHGGWRDPLDEYLYRPTVEYFEALEGTYFFSGHTHVQVQVKLGQKLYCNPGSVGQPRDGDARAAFAVFDGEGVKLHRVEYDVQRIAKEMERCGFSPYFYNNLYAGTRIGGEISRVILSQ